MGDERLGDPRSDASDGGESTHERSRSPEFTRDAVHERERLEEIVGAISHDLRNPLNVITGRIQLARETGDDDHFDAIQRSTDTLETVIDDIVRLARDGHPVTDRETVDLSTLATSTWAELETRAASLDVEDAPTVAADRDRLSRLLEHLFQNAVDHGPAAADSDGEAAITVRIGALGNESGFYVEDTGVGIPAADRERLQAYGETTVPQRDGLGLAMVRRIAEAHGWRVSITESRDGGARFEIGSEE